MCLGAFRGARRDALSVRKSFESTMEIVPSQSLCGGGRDASGQLQDCLLLFLTPASETD